MEYEIEKLVELESGAIIDLPIIRLFNDKNSFAPSYTGPGYLSKDVNGELEIKCYCQGSTRYEDIRISKITPGKLIDDSEYYNLSLMDFNGREWVSERLLLDIDSGVLPQHLVVKAKIRRLSNTRVLPGDTGDPVLKLFINKKIKIPGNTPTVTEVKVAGEERFNSVSFNAATFYSNDFLFTVDYLSDEERPTLCVSSQKLGRDIKLTICGQICEALSFVLGEDIGWAKCELSSGTNLTIIINNSITIKTSKEIPPISEYMKSHAEAVWTLFDCYFRHIYDESRESRHKISSEIYRWLSAANSTVEVKSLVLAISIEGLLKTEFEAFPETHDSQRKDIEKIIASINEISLNEAIKKRVIGAVTSLARVRVQDKIMDLVRRGLVPNDELEAWKRLRNSSAHADSIDVSNFQDHLDKYYKIRTLFNRLIFLRVGYIGEFTNFGEIQGRFWRIDRHKILH